MSFLRRWTRKDVEQDRQYLTLVETRPGGEIGLAFSTDVDGYQFFPVFTTKAALLRWAPEGGTTGFAPLSAVISVLIESPMEAIIIDPASKAPRVILRSDAAEGRIAPTPLGSRLPPSDIQQR